MNARTDIAHVDVEELSLNLAWLRALAVCLMAIGFTAMYAPFYSSFAIENIVGGSFLVVGAMFVAHEIGSRKWDWFAPELLVGGLYLTCGLLLVVHPYGVQLALRVYLAAFFALKGISKAVYALRLRARVDRQWLPASATISLLMGTIIGLGLTEKAAWMVGVFVGLDLVFGGLSTIMICHEARGAQSKGPPLWTAETRTNLTLNMLNSRTSRSD